MTTKHIAVLTAVALCCAELPAQTPGEGGTSKVPMPRMGESWTLKRSDTTGRNALQDAFQFVRGDQGKWSDEPTLVVASTAGKPAGASLDDWFDAALQRHGAPFAAADEVWLLLRTRQYDDNDRIWIDRIERSGSRFSVVMDEAIWRGKYFKTFTFYQTYGINLGKLAPGDYAAEWTIRPRTFTKFAGDGKPTPDNRPADDVPGERSSALRKKFAVAGD
jgi:hypothetical protein